MARRRSGRLGAAGGTGGRRRASGGGEVGEAQTSGVRVDSRPAAAPDLRPADLGADAHAALPPVAAALRPLRARRHDVGPGLGRRRRRQPRQLDLGRDAGRRAARASASRDAEMDASGVVYATVPGTAPDAPVVALCAHVDTSPDAPGASVRPLVHPAWDGTPFALPGDPTADLRPGDGRRPGRARRARPDHERRHDAAGLGRQGRRGRHRAARRGPARASRRRRARARPRPRCACCSRPTRRSAAAPTRSTSTASRADVGYTLDGSGTDRLNAETFNAAEAVVTVDRRGRPSGLCQGHPRQRPPRRARPRRARCRPAKRPRRRTGRDGFFHPHALAGEAEHATLRVLLRDFTDDGPGAPPRARPRRRLAGRGRVRRARPCASRSARATATWRPTSTPSTRAPSRSRSTPRATPASRWRSRRSAAGPTARA